MALATNATEHMRIDSSGNLGIGINTPASQLHLSHATAAIFRLTTDALGNLSSDGMYISMDSTSGQFFVRENLPLLIGTNNSERMRIAADGKVGIGKTATSRFSVRGDGVSSDVIDFQRDVSSADGYLYVDTQGSGIFNGAGATGEGVYNNSTSGFLALWTNSTERLRIDSTGKVGIGVSPTKPFEVSYSSASDWVARVTNTSGTAPHGFIIDFSTASPDNNAEQFMRCEDSTTSRLIIYSDGDVVNHDGTYGTISDGTLKQDIKAASSQWDDVKAIGAIGCNYKHKRDVANKGQAAKNMLGWVAQDVEAISPGLVMDMEVDARAPNGTPLMDEETGLPVRETVKGIRSSILFTKAVMALSEAMTRIEALEAQVAELGG